MPSNIDRCITNIFADINYTAPPGTVTIPVSSTGYLLTAEGDRILIQSTTPPPGTVYTFVIGSTTLYALGRILLSVPTTPPLGGG